MADLSKIKLNGTTYNFKDAVARSQPYYGVCESASTAIEKVVTVDESFVLKTGVQVTIKFVNSVVYQGRSFSLNVNNTGAKTIYRYGGTGLTNPEPSSWYANSIVTLTYDGTNWIINNEVGPYPLTLSQATATQGIETTGKLITAKILNDTITNKLAVTNTLSSGTLIATINGTNIYAPSYTDADGVSY